MNIAIVHYHLNRGGVTQVIANHLRGLNAVVGEPHRLQVGLLYGGRHQGWPERLSQELSQLDLQLCPVPSLDYDENSQSQTGLLARELKSVLVSRGFQPETTVLHVHNHALGKNLSLPGALLHLAQKDYRMLLQVHDFAEDFRPTNYRRLLNSLTPHTPLSLDQILYPQGEHIHYAVLVNQAAIALGHLGIDQRQLHLLPNPVFRKTNYPSHGEARAKIVSRFGIPQNQLYFLYPVRGIRRKNLGELLLWSVAAGDRAHFAVTLPPLNPKEIPRYEYWKKLAASLKLNCSFNVGGDNGFSLAENLAACDRTITTSLAEGFGMVFLESWQAGRPLVGRDLPDITTDFVDSNINFPNLYQELLVPIDWIGQEQYCDAVLGAYCDVLKRYLRELPSDSILRQQCQKNIRNGKVDFGTLDVKLQQKVLAKVHESSMARDHMFTINTKMEASLSGKRLITEKMMSHQRKSVEKHYSLAACGEKLLRIYHIILTSQNRFEPKATLHGGALLDHFLGLKRFRPVRNGL